MQTQTPCPSFNVPADLMQGVVSTIGSLPWNQSNGIMSALVQLVSNQQAAHDAAQPQAGAPAA